MTDAAADMPIERLFWLQEDEQALIREHHGKISSAVGGAVAARFVQVERRINTLLDLQLATEVPLLKSLASDCMLERGRDMAKWLRTLSVLALGQLLTMPTIGAQAVRNARE